MKTYKEFITESQNQKFKLADFEYAYKEADKIDANFLVKLFSSFGKFKASYFSNIKIKKEAYIKNNIMIFEVTFKFDDGETYDSHRFAEIGFNLIKHKVDHVELD